MVDLQRVAVVGLGHRCLRQRLLDAQDGLGVGPGGLRLRAEEAQRALHVRLVLGADVHHARVVLQVVVTVGEAEAPLLHAGDDLRGVLQVLLRAELEERRRAHAVEVRDCARQAGEVGDGVDPGHGRRERLDVRLLDRLLIHAGCIEIAEVLREGLVGRGLGHVALQDLLERRLVLLADGVEAAPPRLVVGDGVGLDPAAARVLEEVVAGLHAAVDRRELHPPGRLHGGGALRCRRGGRGRRSGRRGGGGGVGLGRPAADEACQTCETGETDAEKGGRAEANAHRRTRA